MNSIPTHVSEGKILVCQVDGKSKFIVKDGPYFNPEIGEWEIWFDDEVAYYAATEHNATQMYLQTLSYRKDHYEANPANADDIPFLGEPVAYDDEHDTGGTTYDLHRSEW